MKIITNLRHLRQTFSRPVVGIGIFDGVHRGHGKILDKVINCAKRLKGTSLVITFNPHPAGLLGKIGSPPLLISLRHRLKLLEGRGLDAVCVLNFTREFARRPAPDFIKKIIVDKLRARCVVIGRDFRFGRDKKGGIKLLRQMGEKYGFRVIGLPLFEIGGETVSSTRIRKLVMAGKLNQAARFLGRPVSVLGTVVEGARRGRILGYPTANINPHHEAIPPSGVYAIYALVGRRRYKGVLNIGMRPTFGADKEPTIEAHLFDFDKNIYGSDIEIRFIKNLRPEKRFRGKEELVRQIKIDERRAYMIL
jgi:riboflavin kinase/FMN adenylyltransferase